MKLRWTPAAKLQLKEIESYIAQFSPAAARRTVSRIARRCTQLIKYPHSGRKVPEFNRDDLRELLERPYRIVYRIRSDDQVDILTIWHYRRLMPGRIPGDR